MRLTRFVKGFRLRDKRLRLSGGKSEAQLGFEDVQGDLIAKVGEGRELHFVTKFIHEGQFEFLAVEIGLEINQVGLDAELRGRVLESRTVTDVEDGAMDFAARLGMNCINTGRGEGEAGDIKVGGRETELAAKAIALKDGAGERIGATQHLAGGIEIAATNGFADAGAADGFAIEGDGGEGVNSEFQFPAELLEQLDVAAAFMAEDEIGADAEALDTFEIAGEAADEGFTRLLAEGFIEVNQEENVRAQSFDGAQFLGQGIDEGRDAVWGDDGARVAIKSEDEGEGFVRAGVGDGLANDLLVAQMDAVEEADGEAGFARRTEFVGGANEAHEGG